ncbi:hypothetical protein [Pelistega suis]|uniref:hypothetical protein n=1 Tax=Pelistega suis TaxID=1631957 RepID=UPI00211CBC96|nr:hypothetical protein [Pelistega suis]MCQ9328289.1 hypothetical protein [Pelistega suis]
MSTFQGFMPDALATTERAITECRNLISITKGFKAAKKLISSGMPTVEGNVKGAALKDMVGHITSTRIVLFYLSFQITKYQTNLPLIP